MNKSTLSEPSQTLVIAAFAAIYVVWGSTYLAIRVAVETLPPFLSAGVRFLVAGGLLYAFLRIRGLARPSPMQWRRAAVAGVLLLVGGNGLVMWAEQRISSGFTALLVALAPVWFALIDWMRPGGIRPQSRTIIGIVIGFFGVVVLVNGHGSVVRGHEHWWGALAVIIAGICWAGGSLYSKHNPTTASPWMNAATQMTCGGAALLVGGVLLGEPFRTEWQRISGRSLTALAYLIVFGSWIGFSAYLWVLKTSTASRVSTYAYVNPVIAVFLGWALLGESVNTRVLWGALIIFAGVVTITIPRAALAQAWIRARRYAMCFLPGSRAG